MTVVVNDPLFLKKCAITAEQHKRLLRKFDLVSDHVVDVVALLWLPGKNQTFDNPLRMVHEIDRPVLLSLEPRPRGGLRFTGAISRFKRGEMVFRPLFSYDAALPLTYAPGGPALCAKNIALARRLNELLRGLIDVGRRLFRPVDRVIWPDVVCDNVGTLFEDYTPVLGVEAPNPAQHKPFVPASALDETAPPTLELPLSAAVNKNAVKTADYLRAFLPSAYARDVSQAELIAAANNPAAPLLIRRRSARQVCTVEAVQNLPVGYAGTVLAPVNWEPPHRPLFAE